MLFGIQFKAICDAMKPKNIAAEEYFPNYNVDDDEEEMDVK